MITNEQQNWLNHLNDSDQIIIKPFDPTSEQKFQQIRDIIQIKNGLDLDVQHRGASSLRISGQDEIDVYIPVAAEKFNHVLNSITKIFGNPRSNYPLKRARFVTFIDDKHIDVFVINSDDDNWKELVTFHEYLSSHPDKLDEYRKLKEDSVGISTRQYYQRKIEFINEIMVTALDKS